MPVLNWINVEEAIVINKPSEQVWALIRNFENLSWFKSIAASTTNQHFKPNLPGAERVRFINTLDGIHLVERLLEFDEALKQYSYTIDKIELPGLGTTPIFSKFEATMRVQSNSVNADHSDVVWKSRYILNMDFISRKEQLNQLDLNSVREIISSLYRSGLKDIKSAIDP